MEGGVGNDALLELTWNNIGDYHADRQHWDKAIVYYSKAKNSDKQADCFYALEDWDSLGELMVTLHEGSPLLHSIAKKFVHVGICTHAVSYVNHLNSTKKNNKIVRSFLFIFLNAHMLYVIRFVDSKKIVAVHP